MKTKITSLLAIALLTVSCQNLNGPEPIQEETCISIEELTGIQHDIAVNILSSKFGGYVKGAKDTRATSQFSITPYIEDGDTLLYIAQYDNGWEIYSASHAAPMVLFSSDTGKFDIDDNTLISPLKDMILACVHKIKEFVNEDNKSVNPSWKGIVPTDEDFAKGTISVLSDNGTRKTVYDGDLPPGNWILIENERVSTNTYTSPKLITTKWGQGSPWNTYSKLVYNTETKNNTKAPAGCAPVALSQYMYFTHFKDNTPTYAVTNATAISDGKDYTFWGSSATIWESMAKWDFFPGTDKTALLIGDIGRKLNCIYNYNKTSAYHSDCLTLLKSVYGLDFAIEPFSINKLITSIDNGYPLLTSAYSNKKANGVSKPISGHLFLIDQYQIKTDTIRDLYALVRSPLPAGTIDRWEHDFVDPDGNVIKYAYTKEVFWESCSKQVSMNWGHDGTYDNVFHYYLGDWICGSSNYNLDHEIFVRQQ